MSKRSWPTLAKTDLSWLVHVVASLQVIALVLPDPRTRLLALGMMALHSELVTKSDMGMQGVASSQGAWSTSKETGRSLRTHSKIGTACSTLVSAVTCPDGSCKTGCCQQCQGQAPRRLTRITTPRARSARWCVWRRSRPGDIRAFAI